MKKPDTPIDEELRIKTLHSLNILDTPPEERFDRLTRMAKRLFGVPIALVSLVDVNRQWFKSAEGLDASETPRDVSFCGHAIHGSDVFIIADAHQDERFADNPLVLDEPNVRFYAGCPLRAPNGSSLGTLCIIDQQPRSFDDEDIVALKDIAELAERELAAVQMAITDELTNISNRRGFMLLAQQCLNFCTRQGIPAFLVFIDLDKFKPINDQFGHAEGDRALIAFADQMKTVLRDSDIFARIGGDEFVVLVSNTSIELAETSMARLHQSLDDYNRSANRGYEVLFSSGIIAFDPDKHPTIEALLAEADSLMYERKRRALGRR